MAEIFYFTYGSDAGGGWTKVVVGGFGDRQASYEAAVEAFCAVHPRKDGFVDCAEIYDVSSFRATRMNTEGNYGKRTREIISLTRKELTGT